VIRLGIFLILLALVLGTTGCVVNLPGSTVQYTVKISSAVGGTVSDPGEGLFLYPAGAVVELVAQPHSGYEFAGWVSNAETIADVYDATTTVTLDRNYYFIIANFKD
jgi:hypothetical protein